MVGEELPRVVEVDEDAVNPPYLCGHGAKDHGQTKDETPYKCVAQYPLHEEILLEGTRDRKEEAGDDEKVAPGEGKVVEGGAGGLDVLVVLVHYIDNVEHQGEEERYPIQDENSQPPSQRNGRAFSCKLVGDVHRAMVDRVQDPTGC